MGNVVRAFQRFQCRGTDQQVGDELLARGAAMRYTQTRNPDTGAISPPVTFYGSMAIVNYALQNRAGAVVNLGLGFGPDSGSMLTAQRLSSSTMSMPRIPGPLATSLSRPRPTMMGLSSRPMTSLTGSASTSVRQLLVTPGQTLLYNTLTQRVLAGRP